MMKKVAISIGDLNGIGIQLALENHHVIKEIVEPIYCIDQGMLKQASELLNISISNDFTTVEPFSENFTIKPKEVDAHSGKYAYDSFVHAVALANSGEVDAITTLPIHKKAWELAGIKYKGHTDALRDFFDVEAIMMLGCPQMYVALYTEHIPLKDVAGKINESDLTRFLVDFHNAVKPESTIAVLGLNPHAGDDGVLGNEERIIKAAINNANKTINHPPSTINHQPSTINHQPSTINHSPFTGPMVPDVAFTPKMREKYRYFVAMYHDQGLAPLKALYFDEGINVSLNLPILRTSVDHGTAFDIAYQEEKLNSLSYINAIRYIANP
jgi:4-hydroxythreonine-4-phosphate dehydrogenase